MSTVVLPRWVVGLLVGVCAVCVVAVAFLVGRVTAPAPPAPPRAGETADPSTPARAETSGIEPSAVADGGESTAPRVASNPAARTAGPAGAGPDAVSVAAYFRQMDAVAAEAKASQDPQALARSVLDQAMSGDSGAIEGMIATQRSLEARLGQIVPPPSCREHHQRSVRLFARAIALLERTRDAMAGQGSPDVAGLATEGRAIEAEARAVDALASDLRRSAGLPPVP